MHDPKVLATFARHFQTGEAIPGRPGSTSQPSRRVWTRTLGHAGSWLLQMCPSICIHNAGFREAGESVAGEHQAIFCRTNPSKAIMRSRLSLTLPSIRLRTYTYLWDKVIAEGLLQASSITNRLTGA